MFVDLRVLIAVGLVAAACRSEPEPSASTAAAPAPPPLPAPEPSPPEPEALTRRPPAARGDAGAGHRGPIDPDRDARWLRRLASSPIVSIKKNPGGATITLKVRFSDGAKAVFKPEQKRSVANYRAEIAAYHVDRIVGFDRVAPVVGRTIGLAHLRQHLEHVKTEPEYLERIANEVVARDGRVTGAMIAWHAKRLVSEPPAEGWKEAMRSKDAPPTGLRTRLGEWSDLVSFDYVIDNPDRWSGGNVLTLGKKGPLIFLDQAGGFADWRAKRDLRTQKRLDVVCRFEVATVDALTALGNEPTLGARLERTLKRDPTAPVLAALHFAAVDRRVAAWLDHVRQCVDRFGEDAVMLR